MFASFILTVDSACIPSELEDCNDGCGHILDKLTTWAEAYQTGLLQSLIKYIF